MTTINELRSKVCKQAHLLITKRGYSRKGAMRYAWKSQKFLVEYERQLIKRTKIEAEATTAVQNHEALYNFYHGAGASQYKGD